VKEIIQRKGEKCLISTKNGGEIKTKEDANS